MGGGSLEDGDKRPDLTNSQTSMECCRASAALIFWYVINTSAYYLVKSTLAPTPDQWCHC